MISRAPQLFYCEIILSIFDHCIFWLVSFLRSYCRDSNAVHGSYSNVHEEISTLSNIVIQSLVFTLSMDYLSHLKGGSEGKVSKNRPGKILENT